MKKIIYPLIGLLCFPVMAFSGCKSETVYTLSDGSTGGTVSNPSFLYRDTVDDVDVEKAETVSDTQAPVILVRGDYSQPVNLSSKYAALPKVTAKDNVDANPNLMMTGTDPDGKQVRYTNDGRFLVEKFGQYTFRYTCFDGAGNQTEPVTVTLTLQDEIAPIIDLRSYTPGADGVQDKVSGLTFNTVKLPSVLVHDYYDYNLKVSVGKASDPVETYTEVDCYELAYRPTSEGNYLIRYTATEVGGNGRVSTATIPMTVQSLTQISSFEDVDWVGKWNVGGATNGAKPTFELTKEKDTYTEGGAGMKVTVKGAKGQALSTSVYTKDNQGNKLETPITFASGWSIYSPFYACGTGDISGYEYVMIDVYNANKSEVIVDVWVKTWKKAFKQVPFVIPAGEWKTLYFPISKIDDPTNMESILMTFEGHEEGEWIYYIDNWRVGDLEVNA